MLRPCPELSPFTLFFRICCDSIELYCMYFVCVPAGKHGYTADGGGGGGGLVIMPSNFEEKNLFLKALFTLYREVFSIKI